MNPEEQIRFLTKIVKDNRLHESYCSAFSTSRGGLFDAFHSTIEKTCHCWLERDTIPKGNMVTAIYHKETESFEAHAYMNRYFAFKALLKLHTHLSTDPESPNYWGKHYLLVDIENTPEEESNDGENHSDPA